MLYFIDYEKYEHYGFIFIASSVTSFVARPYPGADTIEVQTNQIRGIDVLVNGIVLELDSSISKINYVEGEKSMTDL